MEKHSICFKRAAEIVGLKEVHKKLESYLRMAGFVDIRVIIKKLPIGPWAKDKNKKVRLIDWK